MRWIVAALVGTGVTACAPIRIESPTEVQLPGRFEQTVQSDRTGQTGRAARGGGPSKAAGQQAGAVARQAPDEAGQEPDSSDPQALSRWWRQWQDPVLVALIEEGLARNRSLAAVEALRQAAEAQAALVDADRGPQLGLDGRAYGLGDQANPLPPPLRAAAADMGMPAAAQSNFNRPAYRGLGVSAAWEPDIFGQKRSDAEAAHQAALAETERWHGAQMLLVTEIADHYLQARALQQRIQQGEARLDSLRRLQRYVEARFRAGQASALDVQEMSTALSTARAELATLGAGYAAHVRSLAVLTGQVPQGFRLPPAQAPAPATTPNPTWSEADWVWLPAPPQGLTPLLVLERRPDVRANQRLLDAQGARLASAKADRLPRFDISFLWQHGRIGLDTSLPGIGTTGGLASASVSVPLFTAGRIGRNIDRADAELRAAQARYDHSLLMALAEVDSSYQLQHGLSRQRHWLDEAARRAARQADEAERLFERGELTLDRALRARIQAQQLAEQRTQGRLAEARNLLLLYKALGGGWAPGAQP